MRRAYFSVYLAFMLLIVSAAPHAALAASDQTYKLTTSEAKTDSGNTISVTVAGDNFTDLYAYEVNLQFDADLVKLTGAKAEQSSGFSISPIVKGNMVQFAHTKVGKESGDSGTLSMCTFTFEPIDSGEAHFSLKTVKLVNSQMTSVTQSNTVMVSAVVDKSPEANQIFTDINDHWAKDVILKAVELAFVDGYPDHTFRPDLTVTRSEFVAMVIRALQIQPSGSDALSFADLDSIPDWSKAYVAEAVKSAIIEGYEDNTFRAANSITRSELAVMIAKVLGLKVNPNEASTFADAGDIPDWAAPYVTAAANAGLIHGRDNNMFAPNDNATRAEAVNLIMSMLKFKGVQGVN